MQSCLAKAPRLTTWTSGGEALQDFQMSQKAFRISHMISELPTSFQVNEGQKLECHL